MKTRIAMALMLTLSAGTALAGPLKCQQVGGDAAWVAHVDATTMLESGLAKFVLAEAQKNNDFVNKLTELRQNLGFDPLRDVRGVTIYGPKLGEDLAVIIIDMTVDQQKIVDWLSNVPTYKEIKYGDHVLRQWTDDAKIDAEGKAVPAKNNFGTFFDEKTVVVATNLDMLKKAVDVMDGKADSLVKTKALQMLPKGGAGTFALATATGVKAAAEAGGQKTALFKTITDISVEIGETKDGTFAQVIALSDDAETATKLRNVVQGFIALGQMMLQEREDLPVLGEKIAVNGEANVVKVSAAVPTTSLIEMVKFLQDMQTKKSAAEAAPAPASK